MKSISLHRAADNGCVCVCVCAVNIMTTCGASAAFDCNVCEEGLMGSMKD